MSAAEYDIVIVGGGINGCGIARDAVGRGLSVYLAEKGDLACATSSASTKLVHGGLRYLEHYEFRLVREALSEREVLMGMAPHIIWPLRFVLPHDSTRRPAWLIRLGLFLYDHIGGRKRLPASKGLDLQFDDAGLPLKTRFRKGFEYSDCWVDDARLVVLNAQDAALRGAVIKTRTAVTSARRAGDHWAVTTVSDGLEKTVTARMLVNAAGPWVMDVISGVAGLHTPENVRLVKGSHIIVPRIFDHDRAYIFQNDDQRIIFAIPYETDFTLIGTTDVDFSGDPGGVAISDQEIAYLASAASEYFELPVSPDDVVSTYSGVRPLFDDGEGDAQETTRDYVLKILGGGDDAPVLNIFGGKITTYRRLAEDAMNMICPHLPGTGAAWTRGAILPGGDIADGNIAEFATRVLTEYPDLPEKMLRRMVRLYGSKVPELLGNARTTTELGQHFGADLYAKEVEYLMDREWACTAQDVLWRRTKVGLRLSEDQEMVLDQWMANRMAGQTN